MEVAISVRSEESGALDTVSCTLDNALTLGRGPESPVPLDGTGISREHLRLHMEGSALFVTDLSSNGTWLNGRRLTRGEPQAVTPAEAIRIPGFEIRIESGSSIGVERKQAVAPPSQAAAEPARVGGRLEAVMAFGASFSKLDRFLIALALATIVLVVLYLTS
jgi:predicted component of type VI protein secretion system